MAQKFVGFKPETLQKKILPALGYDGPSDEKSINLFLASSPSAAAKMGAYTMAARQMVEGKPINANLGEQIRQQARSMGAQRPRQGLTAAQMRDPRYQPTRNPDGTPINPQHFSFGKTPAQVAADTAAAQADMGVTPGDTGDGSGGDNGNGNGDSGGGDGTGTGSGVLSGSQTTKQIQTDPTKMVTTANVVSNDGGAATQIDQQAGNAGQADQATLQMGNVAQDASAAAKTNAGYQKAVMSQGDVAASVNNINSAQGNVSAQAQVDPAKLDPDKLASLQLNAAQLGQAQTVDAPADLEVTPDQLIDGSGVDQSQVDSAFGTGEVKAASVQDEMADLMQDFDGGETPAWAAGAMRNASAAMAARGLSASSMAGMAIVQSAMEAALPIAAQDASNKQQMAMLKAEQRAKFMGMDFDQKFQTKVKNAARISEVANINFSADQQVALENARMAQTVDLANLSNSQAKVMADAASMSQADMTNLDNRQKARAQNAQSFLQMDMQNLDNEQKTTMFKAQANISSILSDQAAENAASQFNATSQNQTDQFFAGLQTQVSQFNTEQQNAMNRFNAGEANAINKFNSSQVNQRDQFNAANHLVIAQANAKWMQNVTTADNAAQNQANRDAAMVANNLTRAAYDEVLQRERDILGWAWKSGENAMARDNAIATAQISSDGSGSSAFSEGLGSFAAKLTETAMQNIFFGKG